jgi:hypothetical protein
VSTASFNKLANKVEKAYEKKGVSAKRAKYIGKATAAKVKMEKNK